MLHILRDYRFRYLSFFSKFKEMLLFDDGISDIEYLTVLGFNMSHPSLIKNFKYDFLRYPSYKSFPSPPLSEVTISDVKGYKAAYLMKNDENFYLNSLFFGSYNLKDKMSCERDFNHLNPSHNCSCGFYSYKSIKDAELESYKNKYSIYLKVENYGDIIEHKAGYRSEEIEVTSIFLKKKCYKCLRISTHITNARSNLYLSSCVNHRVSDSYTLESFSKSINIPVYLK